jgi:hypothetical protein
VAGTFKATGAITLAGVTTTAALNVTDADFVFNDNGGNHDARFEGNTDAALLVVDGSQDLVAIGSATPSNGKLEINQNNAAGGISCLNLDQDDEDEDFIYFEGTSAGDSTKSLSSSTGTTGAKQGAIRVSINGTDRWIRFYDTAV